MTNPFLSPLKILKNSTAVIKCCLGEEINEGTIFFVSPNIGLTAKHNLELDEEGERVISISFPMQESFRCQEFTAEILFEHESLDLAIVKVSEFKSNEFLKIKCGNVLSNTKTLAFGYPKRLAPNGLYLNCQVNLVQDTPAPWDLRLSCQVEEQLADYSGMSGSPIFSNGYVIGIVKEQQADFVNVINLKNFIEAFEELGLPFEIESDESLTGWISREHENTPDDVQLLIDFWENSWIPSTDPVLSEDILTLKRDTELSLVDKWLNGLPEVLRVKAANWDEAIAFLASYAIKKDYNAMLGILLRSFIVKTEKAWQEISKSPEPLILIANFDLNQRDLINARKHYVYWFVSRKPKSEFLNLKPLNVTILIEHFHKLSYHTDLLRKVHASHGRIDELQRQFSVFDSATHWWAQPEFSSQIAPLVLIGSWDETCPDDKQIVSQIFLEMEYSIIEGKLVNWLNREDAFITKAGTVWSLLDQAYVWQELESYITKSQFEAYFSAFKVVLGEINPKYELEPAERWKAAIYDKIPKYSSQLRNGLAKAAAILGNLSDHECPAYEDRLPQDYAEWLVSDLLNRNKLFPEFWGSLSDINHFLAEAGPKSFLSILRASLREDKESFRILFIKEGSVGSVSYLGILNGLEVLAWEEKFLGNITEILAELDSLDPGGNLVNRPSNTLVEIFFPFKPKTNASFEKRCQAFNRLLQKYPKTGFKLVESYLLSTIHSSITFSGTLPRFRASVLENQSETRPRSEVTQFLDIVKRAFITYVEDDPNKWDLFWRCFESFTDSELEEMFSKLASLAKKQIDLSLRLELQKKLRHFLHNYYTLFHGKEEGDYLKLSEDMQDKLKDLYLLLTPEDKCEKHIWLFEFHPELPFISNSDYDEETALISHERLKALDDLCSLELKELLDFSSKLSQPQILGELIGLHKYDQYKDGLIIPEIIKRSTKKTDRFFQGFVNSRFNQEGMGFLNPFLPSMRAGAWSTDFIVLFLLGLPYKQEIWEIASSCDNEVEAKYWITVDNTYIRYPEELPYGIDKLLKYQKFYTAIESLWFWLKRSDKVDPSLAIQVLKVPLDQAVDQPQTTVIGYYIEQLLDYIEEVESLPELDVFQVHWMYSSAIRYSRKKSQTYLHRLISKSPHIFVELLTYAFIEDGTTEKPDIESDEFAIGKRAMLVLFDWKTIPGLNEKGEFNEQDFKAWIDDSLTLSKSKKRHKAFQIEVGKVMAYSPYNPDGTWPHDAICETLDDIYSEVVETSFMCGVSNKRGVFVKSLHEGGKQEYGLSEYFEDCAERIDSLYPNTALVLRKISSSYTSSGRKEDVRHLNEH
jgi:hypothetical protein